MILKKFILALLISLLSTACSPFKAADILSPYSGYTVTKDLPYGKLHRQTLDVYTPTGKLASEDIVIFFYGGSWKSGEKSNYRFIAQPFAEAGFKTILPNYRLYPEVKFPEFVADTAKAVAWIYRKQSKRKPSKI
ncbi:MAG: alpha/beta hydrolase, partial [Nisaea sp.]|nr:alpha/beta hydrolase [Nisaea sp.]